MVRSAALILIISLAAAAAQAPPGGPGWAPGCAALPPGPPPGFETGRPGPMRPGPEDPQGPPVLRFLNLTDSQKQAIKAILDQHRPVRTALRQALAAKTMALREGSEDPSLSEAQLRALQATESAARLQAVLEDRAAFLEVHAVLSREQQAKADRLRLKHQKEQEAHQAFLAEAGPE
jgi:Spy/CpxP family protein refolding chaperone